MFSLRIALSLGLGALAFAPAAAHACGVSGPDGVWACSLDEHKESIRPKWHAGASGVLTSTALRFSGSIRGDETRTAALARLAYSVSPNVTIHFGAGSTFGGHLTLPDGVHEFAAGPTAQVGASWQVLSGKPFVILTSLLSFSAATTSLQGTTEDIGYEAFDLRVGGLVGVTVFDILSPYALARVFGGPVYWHYQGQAVTGTDVSHYQVGAGLALAVARRMEVFAEGVPLGERAVALGV
ncbi:MAG TPA: hypothetical protein VGL13_13740, partial [Polyangiaceae bacterium]